MSAPATPLLYRASVLSRVLAAAVGGYAVARGFAVCAAWWLPQSRSEAVLTATLLAFVVYATTAIWVFSVRRAWQAWVGVVLACLVLAGLAALGASR